MGGSFREDLFLRCACKLSRFGVLWASQGYIMCVGGCDWVGGGGRVLVSDNLLQPSPFSAICSNYFTIIVTSSHYAYSNPTDCGRLSKS